MKLTSGVFFIIFSLLSKDVFANEASFSAQMICSSVDAYVQYQEKRSSDKADFMQTLLEGKKAQRDTQELKKIDRELLVELGYANKFISSAQNASCREFFSVNKTLMTDFIFHSRQVRLNSLYKFEQINLEARLKLLSKFNLDLMNLFALKLEGVQTGEVVLPHMVRSCLSDKLEREVFSTHLLKRFKLMNSLLDQLYGQEPYGKTWTLARELGALAINEARAEKIKMGLGAFSTVISYGLTIYYSPAILNALIHHGVISHSIANGIALIGALASISEGAGIGELVSSKFMQKEIQFTGLNETVRNVQNFLKLPLNSPIDYQPLIYELFKNNNIFLANIINTVTRYKWKEGGMGFEEVLFKCHEKGLL